MMFKACYVTWVIFSLLLMLGALNVHLGFVVGCHDAERVGLLKLKQSLNYTKNLWSSWEGKDCCKWEGVGCDNVTFFVNRLVLQNPYCNPDAIDKPWAITSPKLDHSLTQLTWLNYLDLSCIDFQVSRIPGFIGLFKHLRYLNMSYSNFNGVIPTQLGNLTRLHTLDLSVSESNIGTLSSDLHWVSGLVRLQYLYVDSVRISHSMNSVQLLSMPPLLGLGFSRCQLTVPIFLSLLSNFTGLSTIQQLDLSFNSFEGSIPAVFANMTSLRYLDLSYNQINGTFPLWLRNVRKLQYLDLSGNSFGGPLPHVFANMTSLTYLSLSSNSFNGSIPLCIRNLWKLQNLGLGGNNFSKVEGGVIMGLLGNLCKLQSFDLSLNSIRDEIGAHHNLSKCVTYELEDLNLSRNMIGGTFWLGNFKRLRRLDVSNNAIEGPIPESIGSLSYLERLDLSNNKLTGTLPESLGDMVKLSALYVQSNKISGEIPTSVGKLLSLKHLVISQNNINGTIPKGLEQCKALITIDLSSNNLQGIVSESFFANFSSLQDLHLSFNSLEVHFSSNWSPPFQLVQLGLGSCKMQTLFPQWILKQKDLVLLDLSDNMMSGKLDLLSALENMQELNISHNQFTGPVPYFTSSVLLSIDLSYNLLSGPLVHVDHSATNHTVGILVCQIASLWFLDIQGNNIIGTIPDCWVNSSNLVYINLSSNNISGIIPMSMGQLAYLQFLKLSNNSLQGPIPPTLSMSSSLRILDLGENKLIGNIPISWPGKTHSNLQILRLRGNQLEGVIPTTLCSLPRLQFIDLAHNNLTGGVPLCFGNLMGMESSPSGDLDEIDFVSSSDESTTVVLKGAVFQYTTTLKYVVDLDLSCNALVGSIPDEITNLSRLIGLNLSHNHLTGIIPKKIGKMTSLESLDLSNNHLSGTIPSSISDLTFLINLKLSNNNLHGEIPTGRQLQTLTDPSSYEGNSGLCGDPLPNKSTSSQSHNKPQQKQEDDVTKNPWFYFDIIAGFAVGFWGVVGSLLLKDRFRFIMFQFVGNVADYLFAQVMARLNRFRN